MQFIDLHLQELFMELHIFEQKKTLVDATFCDASYAFSLYSIKTFFIQCLEVCVQGWSILSTCTTIKCMSF